jgi:hypothetical protein
MRLARPPDLCGTMMNDDVKIKRQTVALVSRIYTFEALEE